MSLGSVITFLLKKIKKLYLKFFFRLNLKYEMSEKELLFKNWEEVGF